MKVEASGFDSVYCYENTNVLINKYNIRNQSELDIAERKTTFLRNSHLLVTPVKGNLDYKHLKDIHRYIFQDIYEWAGKERIVDIAKSNLFCRAVYLNDMAEDIFFKYANENYLIGMSKEKVVDRLSYYMGEINALHPFREGNGRTQREFIRCAAMIAGYELDWSKVSSYQMLEASIDSFDMKYDKLKKILSDNMVRMSYKEYFKSAKKIVDKKGPLGKSYANYFEKIDRISKNLRESGYPVNDKLIRGMENLGRIAGHEIRVQDISSLIGKGGELGAGAKVVISELSKARNNIEDLEL